jgi:hypothetical protein
MSQPLTRATIESAVAQYRRLKAAGALHLAALETAAATHALDPGLFASQVRMYEGASVDPLPLQPVGEMA